VLDASMGLGSRPGLMSEHGHREGSGHCHPTRSVAGMAAFFNLPRPPCRDFAGGLPPSLPDAACARTHRLARARRRNARRGGASHCLAWHPRRGLASAHTTRRWADILAVHGIRGCSPAGRQVL
jgi:hypothetical protein